MKLKVNKASGPDDIPVYTLKVLAEEIATLLNKIIHTIFAK